MALRRNRAPPGPLNPAVRLRAAPAGNALTGHAPPMHPPSSFPDFGRRSHGGRSFSSPRVTSGYGTVLHGEHQLHAAIGAGIRCAENLRAEKVAGILRQHEGRVAAIATSLGSRYTTLPQPRRFLAVEALAAPARLRHSSPSPTADPLVRLTDQHEELIRRIESLITRDSSAPNVFSEAIHQHREMVWRLGVLMTPDLDANVGRPLAVVRAVEPLSPGANILERKPGRP